MFHLLLFNFLPIGYVNTIEYDKYIEYIFVNQKRFQSHLTCLPYFKYYGLLFVLYLPFYLITFAPSNKKCHSHVTNAPKGNGQA